MSPSAKNLLKRVIEKYPHSGQAEMAETFAPVYTLLSNKPICKGIPDASPTP
jgi:hypothetical protein